MHETALAKEIVAIAAEILEKQPQTRLDAVRVTIGEMIAVVPDLLKHAYDSLVTGTPLHNSSLEIEIIPITAACEKCNQSFGLDEYNFLCPFCQSPDIQIKTGNEFYIKELEVSP